MGRPLGWRQRVQVGLHVFLYFTSTALFTFRHPHVWRGYLVSLVPDARQFGACLMRL